MSHTQTHSGQRDGSSRPTALGTDAEEGAPMLTKTPRHENGLDSAGFQAKPVVHLPLHKEYGWSIALLLMSLILGVGTALFSGGFINAIAKDRDVKDLSAAVEGLKDSVKELSDQVKTNTEALSEIKVDLTRIEGMLGKAASSKVRTVYVIKKSVF